MHAPPAAVFSTDGEETQTKRHMQWTVLVTAVLLYIVWIVFFLRPDPLSVFVQRRSSDSSEEEVQFGEFCTRPQSDMKWTPAEHSVSVTSDKTNNTNTTAEGDSPSGDGSSVCPTGWTGHNDLCFQYDPTPMTWVDAEKSCQSLGGNLASVHSFYEHQVIQNMIQRVTGTYPLTWLGGYDATQEGTWFWSDGTPFTYNYWDVGQPDNLANADCLLMNFGEEKKFDDQPCSYLKSFVCAKKRA